MIFLYEDVIMLPMLKGWGLGNKVGMFMDGC